MNGTKVSYGLRDDVPVVFSVSPPGTNRIIEVKGTLRDVIRLVNNSNWKIIIGEVDIDAFLERYHSEEKSRPRDKVTQDRNEAKFEGFKKRYTDFQENRLAEAWPKIPEIPVNFKSCTVASGIIAKTEIDLGILGIRYCDFRIDETDPTLEAEMREEAKLATQRALGDLLLKFAAVVLVNRGEGYAPIVNLYEFAQREMKELEG